MLPRGTDGSAANQQLIHRLHALASPPTLLVGGATAWFVDQKAAISANTPLALLILAGFSHGRFLFLMTGLLLLPSRWRWLMNLLTVAVGAGLLVLIFQDGHLASLAGFTPIGGLEESNLVLLFVVAFALSTDYGVFLFGRISEVYDNGMTTRDAVAYGVESTGRLITASPPLLWMPRGRRVRHTHIFFISCSASAPALAVAIDATFVRALLVPALTGWWLGESTWWAPRPCADCRRHGVGLGRGLANPPARRYCPGVPAQTGLLGLGSNVGDRRAQLQRAVDALPGVGVEVIACSSTYDTDPVGEAPDQGELLERVRPGADPCSSRSPHRRRGQGPGADAGSRMGAASATARARSTSTFCCFGGQRFSHLRMTLFLHLSSC